jgi:flagella basal body P-ring formation protein FlgA
LITNMDEAIGLTSKRALQPGKPITRSELVQPILVKRDQPVMIVSRGLALPPQCRAWR